MFVDQLPRRRASLARPPRFRHRDENRVAVSPLFATLTDRSQIAEKPNTLSPFLATHTDIAPVSPAFATHTKTIGVCINSSHFETRFVGRGIPDTASGPSNLATFLSDYPPVCPPAADMLGFALQKSSGPAPRNSQRCARPFPFVSLRRPLGAERLSGKNEAQLRTREHPAHGSPTNRLEN